MNINNWKQKGNIYIWTFQDNPKNYYGWHFTGDIEGCDSLVELLNIYYSAQNGVFRTIKLSIPTSKQYSVPGCSRKIIPEKKLVLEKSSDSKKWDITSFKDKLKFEIGHEQIDRFITSILDVKNGKGDYSINNLWFWWNIS